MNTETELMDTSLETMTRLLGDARQAALDEGPVSAAVRTDRLQRAADALLKYETQLVEAMSEDFSHRSAHQSLFTDIAASIGPLKHAQANLRKWMRPEKRKATFPLNLLGAKARIEYQPLGVVGVISPWNFPVNLTFAPLAGIFAAGNRAMIKPSEFTEQTSELLVRMFTQVFSDEEIVVCTGGPEIGAEFSSLAFDHMIFTGATSVGRHVMRAAADNLVPLTLELGGKSPVILGRSANMEKAALRIMNGKTLNAGQICLAPDYALFQRTLLTVLSGIRKARSANCIRQV